MIIPLYFFFKSAPRYFCCECENKRNINQNLSKDFYTSGIYRPPRSASIAAHAHRRTLCASKIFYLFPCHWRAIYVISPKRCAHYYGIVTTVFFFQNATRTIKLCARESYQFHNCSAVFVAFLEEHAHNCN